MMRASVVFVIALGLVAPARGGTISGNVICTGLRTNAGAVVYVEKIEGKAFEPPVQHAVMDQKGKDFVPKILPVLVGTTVDFRNSDPFAHNVFTPDPCGGKFNLGSFPTGESRSQTFSKSCQAVILCAVHPEMMGYVVAVETPYFAVSAADGTYRIEGVPNGTYSLSVWQERLKKQTQQVNVGGDARADFTLKP